MIIGGRLRGARRERGKVKYFLFGKLFMIVKKIKCKSCLVKSKLTDYVINPYTGCAHGCVYCYADFVRRFQNIKEGWGDFVYVKENCAELLENELKKAKPGHIWMSSVCDCYQPVEAELKLTRKILEILLKYKDKFSLEVLTKSSLIKRDFDLLKKLNAEVGLSIGQLDEKVARKLEPFASSPKLRVETLREARENGIRVFGFISPVVPGLTNLEDIFRELGKVKVDYVWVELLNMKKSVIDRIYPLIKKEFEFALLEFERAKGNPSSWYGEVKKEVEFLSKKYGVKVREVVRHDLKSI